MKLWKIMLAALVCVLMLSAVAMAEECTHENKYLDIPNTQINTCKGYKIVPWLCPDCDAKLDPYVETWEADHDVDTFAVTKADCASFGHKVVAYNKCKTCGEITYKAPKTDYDVDVPRKANGCGVEGYSAHKKCSICEATKDKVVYPKLTHDYTLEVGYDAPTCEYPGLRVMQCKVQNVDHDYCNATKDIELPKVGHTNSNDWRVIEPATCTETGVEASTCVWCFAQAFYRDIPATGHNFYTAKEIMKDKAHHYRVKWPTCTAAGWAYAQCKNGICVADQYVELAAIGHDWSDWTVTPYDCVKGAIGTRTCENGCGVDPEKKVFIEAEGHKWVTIGGIEPTCTDTGVVEQQCTVCGTWKGDVVLPATGHKNYKETARVEPKCGVPGSVTKECADCKKTITEEIPALTHAYSWVDVVAPSPAGNGKSEYKCAHCGDVAETKTIKYSKWYYNNTMTSFGPSTRELVGGNDWYRVTPVDLTVDGVYTYDLIASNKFVVGKVTIAVNAGALTVSYKTNNNVEVNAESLLIYANKADLATGTAVSAPVGAAIDAAANFPGDSKVLVSLVLTGNYDAAGKTTMDAAAASSMIANID